MKAACKKPKLDSDAGAGDMDPTANRKRKSACADPDPITPSPGGRPSAEPKSGPKRTPPGSGRCGRGRQRELDLKEKQAAEDVKKQERMQKAQDKADEMLKLNRSSEIVDLQPPRGFTNKSLAAKQIALFMYLHQTSTSIGCKAGLFTYMDI